MWYIITLELIITTLIFIYVNIQNIEFYKWETRVNYFSYNKQIKENENDEHCIRTKQQ